MKFDIIQNGTLLETKDLPEGSWKIGRASGCDIQLKSAQVSKQHALLVIKGNKAAIVDLGSSNGVFVNGILVRKQRIEATDEVSIAEFYIRVAKTRPQARSASNRPSANTEGSAALDASPAFEPPSEEADLPGSASPQDRLLKFVDEKVLVPLYGAMNTADWRLILVSILLGTLVSSVILSVIPIVRWGRNVTTKEALARAHTILSQTVRENIRILSKTNDFTRLNVEACEADRGILSCFIIDPRGNTILAPTKMYNQAVTDVYSLLAIKRVTDPKQKDDQVSVQKDDNTYIVAEPVNALTPAPQTGADPDTNPGPAAIALATFEIPSGISSTFEPLVEASLFAILMSLAAYFLIYKMVTYPILQIHEQVDAALKGEDVTVSSPAKLVELEDLATAINFAISRFKQAGGGGGQMAVAPMGDQELEGAAYLRSVEEFDSVTSDAILLLDVDKRVRYVGRVLEDLIGMRNQYAKNQNISDACRDQSFAGTCLDMADKVSSSLGQAQQATLDINGESRNMVAVGHKDNSGGIHFILLTVKMDA